ncbi:hypothetical protein N431DRAFT_433337 [Stipitochalara longipes BDJ]|nr:hypothetical protein N431DRAFT_433337 [Stipitochalara longipes BDJ]
MLCRSVDSAKRRMVKLKTLELRRWEDRSFIFTSNAPLFPHEPHAAEHDNGQVILLSLDNRLSYLCHPHYQLNLKMSTPTPPAPTATPAEVRTYFSTVLTTLHSVPKSDAEKIAAKWQFGRGSELRYYDLSTFREIFGVEAGTVLFGHARGELSGDSGKEVRNRGGERNVVVVKKGRVKHERDIFGVTPGCEFFSCCKLGLSRVGKG